MKAWQIRFLYFLVLNVDVPYVTSLEEKLADSIFGEFPRPSSKIHPHLPTLEDFLNTPL